MYRAVAALSALVGISVLLFLPARAQNSAPQDGLPEAPGKAVVLQLCTQCHGTEYYAGQPRSRSSWDDTIGRMVEKGLQMSDAQYTSLIGYFSRYLNTEPFTINVNKASAQELQEGLDLDAKSAQALVKYRESNGALKDLNDVAKALGVDAATLQSKKDSIKF